MNAISVKNLNKVFTYYEKKEGFQHSLKNLLVRKQKTKEAVKNISFDIDSGDIIGFLGPNGAGKTTTLKMLSGILYPTSGEVHVLGYCPEAAALCSRALLFTIKPNFARPAWA